MRVLFLILLFAMVFQTSCNIKKKNKQNNFEFIINGFAREIYIKNNQYDFIDNPKVGFFDMDSEYDEFNKCIVELQINSKSRVVYTLGVFKIDQNYSVISNYSNSSYCETITVKDKFLVISLDSPSIFDIVKKLKENNNLVITAKYKLKNKLHIEEMTITQDAYEFKETDEKYYHVNSSFLYFSLPLNFSEIDKNYNVLDLKTRLNTEAYFTVQLKKNMFAILHKIDDEKLNLSSNIEVLYPKSEEFDVLNNGHRMQRIENGEVYDSSMRMIQIKDRLYFYAFNYNHIAYPVLNNSKNPITITFKKLNGGIEKYILSYHRD